VSIYLVPDQHGRGYGARLLLTGHEWLAGQHERIREVRADVLAENRQSAEAFRQAGFRLDAGRYVKRIG
jgi:RimJ/RimL family protein N-acetyltransferase